MVLLIYIYIHIYIYIYIYIYKLEKVKKDKRERKPCRYRWHYLCCFTLNVLDGVIHDIVEGDVWYCSQPNLLLLGPSKTGTALETRSSVASESACPLILCVLGQWFFLTTPTAVELSV